MRLNINTDAAARIAVLCITLQLLAQAEAVCSSGTDDAEKYLRPVLFQREQPTLEEAVVQHLGLQVGTTLSKRVSKVIDDHIKVTRFDRYVDGILVYGSLITIESDVDEKLVYHVFTEPETLTTIKALPNAPLSVSLSPDDAILSTASAFGVARSLQAGQAQMKEARLVWYSEDSGKSYTLSYETSLLFTIPQFSKPTKPEAIIDAHTGKVLRSWNGVQQVGALASINTLGGNNCPGGGMKAYKSVRVFQNVNNCTYKTPDFEVHNYNHASGGSSSPWSFPCSSANTTFDNFNGGYGPCNDLAFALNTTVAMYKQYFGEYPMDRALNPAAVIIGRCHFGVASDYAAWDGTYLHVGDGSSTSCPRGSLDIVAHEVAHILMNKYNALQTIGQAGAISESVADMGGVTAEYFAYGSSSYKIGNEVTRNGAAFRDLCASTTTGGINHITQWTNDTSKYAASGLLSTAFCTLSQMCGWNPQSAYTIFVYANAFYWTPNVDFTTAACGLRRATINFYGNNKMRTFNVVTALAKVGLFTEGRSC